VALDRQSVEKKDFPIARRGYEPEAVDAHLARLAGEIEALQRQQSSSREGGGSASLAIAASEQVRAIVEAAESSAAEIEAAARDEAARIRGDAEADARSTRDDAVVRSQDHVGKVGEATTMMLQRVDAMESELGALLESLRTGSNRLNADLTLLKGNMGELYGAAGGTAEPAPAPAPLPVAEPAPVEEPAAEGGLFASTDTHAVPDPGVDEIAAAAAPLPPHADFAPAEPVAAPPAPEPATEPATVQQPAAPAPAPSQAATDADESARLVALNMALNGTPRDEVDRYLAENFDLADRARLVDEVYETVGG
jgi:DivIVA domain-containing protein